MTILEAIDNTGITENYRGSVNIFFHEKEKVKNVSFIPFGKVDDFIYALESFWNDFCERQGIPRDSVCRLKINQQTIVKASPERLSENNFIYEETDYDDLFDDEEDAEEEEFYENVLTHEELFMETIMEDIEYELSDTPLFKGISFSNEGTDVILNSSWLDNASAKTTVIWDSCRINSGTTDSLVSGVSLEPIFCFAKETIEDIKSIGPASDLYSACLRQSLALVVEKYVHCLELLHMVYTVGASKRMLPKGISRELMNYDFAPEAYILRQAIIDEEELRVLQGKFTFHHTEVHGLYLVGVVCLDEEEGEGLLLTDEMIRMFSHNEDADSEYAKFVTMNRPFIEGHAMIGVQEEPCNGEMGAHYMIFSSSDSYGAAHICNKKALRGIAAMEDDDLTILVNNRSCIFLVAKENTHMLYQREDILGCHLFEYDKKTEKIEKKIG